jgi:hypothetical protein
MNVPAATNSSNSTSESAKSICGFLQIDLVRLADIVHLAFGKPKSEDRPCLGAEEDQGTITARHTTSRSSDSLFDEATAKVGIDHTATRTRHRFAERRVNDPFFAGEPLEPSVFEDPQSTTVPF